MLNATSVRLRDGATIALHVVLLFGACGDMRDSLGRPGDESLTEYLGRDSAGVRIVEYAEDAWIDAPVWRLEPEPMLAIGLVHGAREYQFHNIQGALRLDDGRLVVADGGSGELRFFDSQGVHLRSVGRHGDGPGEYRAVAFLARYAADSLLVWDGYLARGTVLDAQGTFARTLSRPSVHGSLSVAGTFSDGGLLGSVASGFRPRDFPEGIVRRAATYVSITPDGRVDTISELFSEEGYSTPTSFIYSLPFARRAVVAADGDRMHYASSDRYEIHTYSRSGDLIRIVRGARASPLRRRDIDRALEGRSTGTAEVRRVLSEIPYPETMPAIGAMKVDATGNLWVGDYLAPGEEERVWTVFGTSGELRGSVVIPSAFTLYEVGADHVLGKAPDELGVERVLIYRLDRGADRPG